MYFNISFREHGVYVSYIGDITMAHIMEVQHRLWSDPRWDDLQFGLIDMRKVLSFDVDMADLVATAAKERAALAKVPPGRRLALIAEDTEIQEKCQGFLDFFQATGMEARLFTDFNDALEWTEGPS